MPKDICWNCGKETDLEHIENYEDISVRGEVISVLVKYFKCHECGGEYEDSQSSYDPLALAYKEYRQRHNMMQPDEIRGLRQRYGLTQRDLSKLLGWGEVTLCRYENGALQENSHDTTLRLIKDDPHILLNLVIQNGDFLPIKKRERLISLLENEIQETHSFPLILEELFGKYAPDILCGFRKLNLDKVFQAIIFFCVDGTLKTKLNKLLFYSDFKHYKNNALGITGLRYIHLIYGPVPDNYEHYYATLQDNEGAIRVDEQFIGDYVGEVLSAVQKPDLSIFSDAEIKTLIEVKQFFKSYSASRIKEFSHREKGYRETSDGEIIPYFYADHLQI
ncbi:MAG: type II TA system antitoxin MqsA family protein [Desulfobaccales bacterium]|jgi:putative zinc finger/helix-turn-helix YgiT family protein